MLGGASCENATGNDGGDCSGLLCAGDGTPAAAGNCLAVVGGATCENSTGNAGGDCSGVLCSGSTPVGAGNCIGALGTSDCANSSGADGGDCTGLFCFFLPPVVADNCISFDGTGCDTPATSPCTGPDCAPAPCEGCEPPPPCTVGCEPPPCTVDCGPTTPPCTANCGPEVPPCTANCNPTLPIPDCAPSCPGGGSDTGVVLGDGIVPGLIPVSTGDDGSGAGISMQFLGDPQASSSLPGGGMFVTTVLVTPLAQLLDPASGLLGPLASGGSGRGTIRTPALGSGGLVGITGERGDYTGFPVEFLVFGMALLVGRRLVRS